MKKKIDSFCIFILSHARPDNVITFTLLERYGYTRPVFVLIDDDDKTAETYRKNFGDKLILIDKPAVVSKLDDFDNFGRHAVLHARNACFDIAERLGFEYFLQLDDDYTAIYYRYPIAAKDGTVRFGGPIAERTLTGVLEATLELLEATGAHSIAFSQGGDWISGEGTFNKRKCMNSFFCATSRRFQFVGRANEDVNTYVWLGSRGYLFLTIPHFQINQRQTQKQAGGTTDVYLDEGTYVKSFYSILCAPSCVTVAPMGSSHKRLHHKINWPCAVPCLISDRYRKL